MLYRHRPLSALLMVGGTKLDSPISTPLTGLGIAGATVAEGRTFDGYGYVTLERGE